MRGRAAWSHCCGDFLHLHTTALLFERGCHATRVLLMDSLLTGRFGWRGRGVGMKTVCSDMLLYLFCLFLFETLFTAPGMVHGIRTCATTTTACPLPRTPPLPEHAAFLDMLMRQVLVVVVAGLVGLCALTDDTSLTHALPATCPAPPPRVSLLAFCDVHTDGCLPPAPAPAACAPAHSPRPRIYHYKRLHCRASLTGL